MSSQAQPQAWKVHEFPQHHKMRLTSQDKGKHIKWRVILFSPVWREAQPSALRMNLLWKHPPSLPIETLKSKFIRTRLASVWPRSHSEFKTFGSYWTGCLGASCSLCSLMPPNWSPHIHEAKNSHKLTHRDTHSTASKPTVHISLTMPLSVHLSVQNLLDLPICLAVLMFWSWHGVINLCRWTHFKEACVVLCFHIWDLK